MNLITNTDKHPHVCFYVPYSYPLFNPEYQGDFGGSEVRVSIIAKELAKRDRFRVTLLVADCGQPHVEYRHGVQLVSLLNENIWNFKDELLSKETVVDKPLITGNEYKAKETYQRQQSNGIINNLLKNVIDLTMRMKWISVFIYLAACLKSICVNTFLLFTSEITNFIKKIFGSRYLFGIVIIQGKVIPIWQKEVAILDEVDADIYIVPGNHHMSMVMANYCWMRKKKYIFLAGSDKDYAEEVLTDPNGSDIYGVPHSEKKYAIEHATFHVIQSQRQASMLGKFGRYSAQEIHNPFDLTNYYPRARKKNFILWVGNSNDNVKRPSMVLKLAKQLSQYNFMIVMKSVGNYQFTDQYYPAASNLSNVSLKTHIPFTEIEEYYAQANLFINTSTFEGFPNTFLQAAKYGVPIIATDVDPGGMLSQHKCGITCGGNYERFVDSIQRIMIDSDLYDDMSAACLQYVNEYHDKDKIIPQYEDVFNKVLKS